MRSRACIFRCASASRATRLEVRTRGCAQMNRMEESGGGLTTQWDLNSSCCSLRSLCIKLGHELDGRGAQLIHVTQLLPMGDFQASPLLVCLHRPLPRRGGRLRRHMRL